MSRNDFSNLMNQYSGEAAHAKQQEERSVQRRKVLRSVLVNTMRLCVAAAIGASIYYHQPIQDRLEQAYHKVFPGKSHIQAEQEAKIKGINVAAAKRDQTLEEIAK
jgi:hypothetical protein